MEKNEDREYVDEKDKIEGDEFNMANQDFQGRTFDTEIRVLIQEVVDTEDCEEIEDTIQEALREEGISAKIIDGKTGNELTTGMKK